ncbi:hypothetical protein KJ980_06125 [Patescibacteria group bacterium]|nr:hypothetical protein [Patescibacteria group bacterium]MBU4016034.1 hypothetical protein [Patescibacteria group bacterium]MBU4099197.1 hypothetical protein [Patescibacteria group bacterium]
MNIQTEAELVSELVSVLKHQFKTDSVVREFAGGYGIADLVFARNFFTKNNILNRVPINNYYALKSYLSLSDNTPFTIDDITRSSGTSRFLSQKIISSLLSNKYIYKESNVYFKNKLKFDNPIKRLVAIEVKLKDWRQGILQARRYKSFTDECYLAILSSYEKNIDCSYLEKFGIGLILFNNKTGRIWIKRKPIKNNVLSFYEDVMGLFAKELFLHQTTSLKF